MLDADSQFNRDSLDDPCRGAQLVPKEEAMAVIRPGDRVYLSLTQCLPIPQLSSLLPAWDPRGHCDEHDAGRPMRSEELDKG